jgi:hypothetical protein
MQSTITRLALFQIITIVYITLGIGVVMRVAREEGPESPQALAVFARDYGILLFPIPMIWLIAAVVEAHRPKRDTGDFKVILGSGIGLLVLLFMFAFVATLSASHPLTHVVKMESPPATPVPARFKHVMEQ